MLARRDGGDVRCGQTMKSAGQALQKSAAPQSSRRHDVKGKGKSISSKLPGNWSRGSARAPVPGITTAFPLVPRALLRLRGARAWLGRRARAAQEGEARTVDGVARLCACWSCFVRRRGRAPAFSATASHARPRYASYQRQGQRHRRPGCNRPLTPSADAIAGDRPFSLAAADVPLCRSWPCCQPARGVNRLDHEARPRNTRRAARALAVFFNARPIAWCRRRQALGILSRHHSQPPLSTMGQAPSSGGGRQGGDKGKVRVGGTARREHHD